MTSSVGAPTGESHHLPRGEPMSPFSHFTAPNHRPPPPKMSSQDQHLLPFTLRVGLFAGESQAS